jgi:class 3 adenylate cyclase/tetratricopeptide (TPR) repeat protein
MQNPDGFRFCGFCGSRLLTPSVKRYETRKTVTVVFVDLVGSTELGERLDPEPLRELVLRYYQHTASVLTRHGGTVAKFIGDAVMALFGIPVIHEDDALRAVRAAAELNAALTGLNAELSAAYGVRLGVRTGVNTGEVVAGHAVWGQDVAVGDAVNVAARLEQAAQPGEVLLGEDTYRLVRDAVVVDPVTPLALKGKSLPVAAFRLRTVRPGAAGRAQRLRVPVVGRAKELAALDGAFEDAVAMRACRLVTVLGTAGIGKSRLVHEFLALVGMRATVLHGRCLDYGEGITFWPVSEMLREAMAADSGQEDPRAWLGAVLAGGERADAVVERLAGLLGLADRVGEELAWAVRKLFEALGRRRPLVLVFDDLHWAEPTLLDLIQQIVDSAKDAPILVICVARQELLERRPGWGEREPQGLAIALEPLSDQESADLTNRLLGNAELAGAAQRHILDTAGGNPLFIEELVAMLVDDGVLRRQGDRWTTTERTTISAPPTIAAVLAARIDRLSPEERAVLERASVIGQTFYQGAVAALSPAAVKAHVGAHLLSLTRKELVRPARSDFGGQDAFRFHHLLVRDAAYRALPKRTRADLHERFAGWLETVAGEQLVEYQEILGHHLERACHYRAELGPVDETGRQLASRAAGHLAAAGRRAHGNNDVPAAVKLLGRASRLLPPADPARLVLLPDLAEALEGAGELDRAGQVVAEATRLASVAGDRAVTARARMAELSLRVLTDPGFSSEEARREAERAIEMFEETGDALGLAKAWRLRGLVHREGCRATEGETTSRQVLRYARQAGDRRLEAWSLVESAFFAFYGPTPAVEAVQRCRRILEELASNPRAQTWILDLLGGLHAMAGDAAAAERLHADAQALRREIAVPGYKVIGTADVGGYLYLWAGRPADAERLLRQSYTILDQLGEKAYLSTVAPLLARALDELGDHDEEIEQLTRVSQAAAGKDDMLSQILWRGTRAKLLARHGAGAEAERLAREAVWLAEAIDYLFVRGDALLDLADVLRSTGHQRDALAAVDHAVGCYERKGNLASLARARSLRTDLHGLVG